jgi:predicted branched-subunit amino acid permease
MMDRQDLRDFWAALWPFVPPAIGAYFGLRWSVEQSKGQALANWFCSAFLALFIGQAIGEYWQLGTKATSGVSIIVAMLLSDLMAVLVAATRQWAADPVGTFRRWRDAWLGRGGGQ